MISSNEEFSCFRRLSPTGVFSRGGQRVRSPARTVVFSGSSAAGLRSGQTPVLNGGLLLPRPPWPLRCGGPCTRPAPPVLAALKSELRGDPPLVPGTPAGPPDMRPFVGPLRSGVGVWGCGRWQLLVWPFQLCLRAHSLVLHQPPTRLSLLRGKCKYKIRYRVAPKAMQRSAPSRDSGLRRPVGARSWPLVPFHGSAVVAAGAWAVPGLTSPPLCWELGSTLSVEKK